MSDATYQDDGPQLESTEDVDDTEEEGGKKRPRYI